MSVPIDVSLLICTRDRAASLARLLASVSAALAGARDIAVEVIVVDNGSVDDTARYVEDWRATQDIPVRLLREPRLGLARARNRAIAAARGAILAMTDDDCTLDRGYFAALAAAFADRPSPVVIGGRIRRGDPADLPVTIKTEDHPMTAPPGDFPGGFVMGANLAFTASVAAMTGPFDERFGAGAAFAAAEDTDFLFRAMGLGIQVRYDPGFAVDHYHGRRETAEETRLLAGYSYGDGALYAKHLLRDPRILRYLWRDFADLARDRRDPVTVHRGIPRFYRFRLHHKLRGMAAYAGATLKPWRTKGAARGDALPTVRTGS